MRRRRTIWTALSLCVWVPAAAAQGPPPAGSDAAAPRATVRAPAPGSTTQLWRPTVAFDVPDRDRAARARLRVLIDRTDVTEFAAWDATGVRATPPVPLTEGPHVAELIEVRPGAAPGRLARVEFLAVAPRRRTAADLRMSDDGQLEAGTATDGEVSVEPHVDGVVRTAGGETRVDATWDQDIPLGTGFDGEAPVVTIEHVWGRMTAMAGMTAAGLVTGSTLLGATSVRPLVGGAFDGGRFGTVSASATGAAALPGAGGDAAEHVWVQQAAWRIGRHGAQGTAAALTVLALAAGQQTGEPGAGESLAGERRESGGLGVLASVRLPGAWALTAESSMSYSRVQEAGAASTSRDAAFRVAVAGRAAGHQIEGRLSRVGPMYANLADPGLRSDRREADLEVSRRGTRLEYRMRAQESVDGLDRRVAGATERRLAGALAVRPAAGVEAGLEMERRTVDARDAARRESRVAARTTIARGALRTDVRGGWTGIADQRTGDASRVQVSGVVRWTIAGPVTLAAGAARDERRGSGPSTFGLVHVEPAWERPGGGWRIAGALAFERTRTAWEERGGQWVRAAATRSLRWRWLTATLGLEGRLDRTRDLRTGDLRQAGRLTVSATWNPEGHWRH